MCIDLYIRIFVVHFSRCAWSPMIVYFLTSGVVVVVVFAFASPCTGAKYTRHQPPTATPVLLSSRVVGPYLRTRVPPPFVWTNEQTNIANATRKKNTPFSGPSSPSTSGCVTDKSPTPLLHPFRASRRWQLGTGYVFTITNSMRPFVPRRSVSPPFVFANRADLHGEIRESYDDLKRNDIFLQSICYYSRGNNITFQF